MKVFKEGLGLILGGLMAMSIVPHEEWHKKILLL